MSEIGTNHPEEHIQPENIRENISDGIERGIANIGESYMKCLEPKSLAARQKAITQLESIEKNIAEYKIKKENIISGGKKDFDNRDTGWTQIENKIRIAKMLVMEQSSKTDIIEALASLGNYDLEIMEGFIPKKYMKDLSFTNAILKSGIIKETLLDPLQKFIVGETDRMPSFTSKDFDTHRNLIIQALKKPEAILGTYENFALNKDLTKNQNFIRTINDILVQQHPNSFAIIQNAKWYKTNGKLDLNKINTLLDVLSYRSPDEWQKMIKMMSAAEGNNSKEVKAIFDDCFSGTEIGNELYAFFEDTPLRKNIEQASRIHIREFTESKKNHTPGSILDILKNNSQSGILIQKFFSRIPTQKLDDILTHFLGDLESQYEIGDTTTFQKIIQESSQDKSLDGDILYMSQFLEGLTHISLLGDPKTKNKKSVFYKTLKSFCDQGLNVKTEKETINGQNKNNTGFSIINEAFQKEKNPSLQEKKNAAFETFLRDVTDDSGNIILTKQAIKQRLEKIFDGSPKKDEILKKLNQGDGREIFKMLANGFVEKKNNIEKQSAAQGLDLQKWGELQKSEPQKLKKLLEKLNKKGENTDDLLNILKENGIISQEMTMPKDQDEKRIFVEDTIKKLNEYTRIAQNAQIYNNPHTQSEFSAAWQSGDFRTFNQKIQEQEQKKENNENNKTQQETNSGKTETKGNTIIPFDSRINYGEIPTGQIMALGDTFIHKDSNNMVSIFSKGITIEKIKITNPREPLENINKAISAAQFLKESGLEIFGKAIQDIIETINQKQRQTGGRKIDITDGIDIEEGCILLGVIDNIIGSKDNSPHSEDRLNVLKKHFMEIKRNGGLLQRLQSSGLATNNTINRLALDNAIKNLP